LTVEVEVLDSGVVKEVAQMPEVALVVLDSVKDHAQTMLQVIMDGLLPKVLHHLLTLTA
jgi:hypothetical protein